MKEKLEGGAEGVGAINPRIPCVMEKFWVILVDLRFLIQLGYQRFSIFN